VRKDKKENNMQTLKPIDPSTAGEKARQLLGTFEQRGGRSPNMLRVMAQSPAILEAISTSIRLSSKLVCRQNLRL